MDSYISDRELCAKFIYNDVGMRIVNEGPMLNTSQYGKDLQTLYKLLKEFFPNVHNPV